jgi:hypothetical protein
VSEDQILWLTSLVGLGAAGVIGYLVALWPWNADPIDHIQYNDEQWHRAIGVLKAQHAAEIAALKATSESPRPPANVDAETERRGREQSGLAAHGTCGSGGTGVDGVPTMVRGPGDDGFVLGRFRVMDMLGHIIVEATGWTGFQLCQTYAAKRAWDNLGETYKVVNERGLTVIEYSNPPLPRVPCATPFLDKHAPGFVAKARKPKPKTKRKPKR